ncbi:hypothetical protein Emag_004099 [Eimeria magna]
MDSDLLTNPKTCAEIVIEQIDHAQLGALLSLSLRCRLLQDGAWIHCGSGMQHMLDGRVLSASPDQQQKRAHVNCPAFSFGVRVNEVKRPRSTGPPEVHGQLRLLPLIFRVLPLRENEERGRCVFCLPRLASPASLQTQASQPPATSPLKTKEDFQRFWFRVSAQVRSMLAARVLSCLSTSEVLVTKRLVISWPAGLQAAAALGAASRQPQTSFPSACEIQLTGASLADLNPPKCQDSEAGGPSRLLPPPALARRVQTEKEKPKEESPKMSPKEMPAAACVAEQQPLQQQQQLELMEEAAEGDDAEPQRPAVVVRLLPPPQLYAPERLAETWRLAQHQQPQQKQEQQQMQHRPQQQQHQQHQQQQKQQQVQQEEASSKSKPSLPEAATATTPAVLPSTTTATATAAAATAAATAAAPAAVSGESPESGMQGENVGGTQKTKKQTKQPPTKKARTQAERRLREQQQEQELLLLRRQSVQQQPQSDELLQQQQEQQEDVNVAEKPPAETKGKGLSGSSVALPEPEKEKSKSKQKERKAKTTKAAATSRKGK